MKRKAYGASLEALQDRCVRAVCSTEDVDRMGEVVVQAGIGLDSYRENPVVLWQHDPGCPIARCRSIGLADGCLQAEIEFPPEGVSKQADEVYGLIKAGIINTTSIGFDPIEMQPIEEGNSRGPQRYLASEMLELSFVSIPANRGAVVTQRQHRQQAPVVRSLYDVGRLAELLQATGWLREEAQWEAEWEQDASKVPAMLGEAMEKLAAALLAMTAEEVAELMADAAEPQVPAEDAAYVAAGKTPAVRRFLAGVAAQRRTAPHTIDRAAEVAAARKARSKWLRTVALG